MPDLARPGLCGSDESGDAGALLELVKWRPPWQADAACREHPEVTWFASRGESTAPARRVCATCLVRPECAAWALAQGSELHGVWGGLTDHDRRSGTTEPRAIPEPPKPQCRRCGAAGGPLTGKLCAACAEPPEWTTVPVEAGCCVKCGQPTDGVKVHRVEGHLLHASPCYTQAYRQAAKLGTTIGAVVEQLAGHRTTAALLARIG